jgi:hypothetical protein
MTNDQQRTDRAVSYLTRRRALAGAGVLVASGGSVIVASDPASAAVSVDELSIPDESFTRGSVTPQLDVTAQYRYDAGSQPVERLRFRLLIDGEEIALTDLVTDRATLENSTTLSGVVTDAEAWSESDFAPDVAETVEREVTVGLEFAVLDREGSVIVKDSATDTAVVSVSHPQESKITASVGGTGEFSAADN